MTFKSLSVSLAGSVAHLRLTRPELSNYVDETSHAELPEALAQIANWTDDVAALIISAEGPHFMVGADLEMLKRAYDSLALRERLLKEGLAIIHGMLDLPYPVIVAVQGSAIGLGASIVSCGDIVVAARGVPIADPHVVLGTVAGDGGIMGWSQSVGIMRAKRYLLTGDPILAEDAHAMGLVSDLVDTPDDVLPAAQALADRIAAMPRSGIRGTKRAFSRLTKQNYGAAFELSFAYEMQTLAGKELQLMVDKVLASPDSFF